ncbi:MAG: endo alpha-1,4 polygalactosaminidase [Labilithrix sp.]|nr:endo alpha-1,4 polygalactosaminidase [Labilithrix sp.]
MPRRAFEPWIVRAVVVAGAIACAQAKPRAGTFVRASADDAPEAAPAAPVTAGESAPESSRRLATTITSGVGFPQAGPWVSFYGSASQMGDLARVARTFRIINIDADPSANHFTDAQLQKLRAGGKNRVLSYMNVGACEHFRSYWSTSPPSLLSCAANRAAQRGSYEGYPDETWMDPSNTDYQRLILEHVAPRLAARVDGFYLDNLEILEHAQLGNNGPCGPQCRQGGLDLVRLLREKFPEHLIVMQNATSDVTRLGMTGGVAFPTLLDGIAHEEVYAPQYDATAEAQLVAWSELGLVSKSGRPFWIGIEDYAGNCKNEGAARAALTRARRRGFSPYVSDESGGQKVVCFWD